MNNKDYNTNVNVLNITIDGFIGSYVYNTKYNIICENILKLKHGG